MLKNDKLPERVEGAGTRAILFLLGRALRSLRHQQALGEVTAEEAQRAIHQVRQYIERQEAMPEFSQPTPEALFVWERLSEVVDAFTREWMDAHDRLILWALDNHLTHYAFSAVRYTRAPKSLDHQWTSTEETFTIPDGPLKGDWRKVRIVGTTDAYLQSRLHHQEERYQSVSGYKEVDPRLESARIQSDVAAWSRRQREDEALHQWAENASSAEIAARSDAFTHSKDFNKFFQAAKDRENAIREQISQRKAAEDIRAELPHADRVGYVLVQSHPEGLGRVFGRVLRWPVTPYDQIETETGPVSHRSVDVHKDPNTPPTPPAVWQAGAPLAVVARVVDGKRLFGWRGPWTGGGVWRIVDEEGHTVPTHSKRYRAFTEADKPTHPDSLFLDQAVSKAVKEGKVAPERWNPISLDRDEVTHVCVRPAVRPGDSLVGYKIKWRYKNGDGVEKTMMLVRSSIKNSSGNYWHLDV